MSKVLVVDDEPRMVQLLKRCLVPEGYSVASVGDGVEALRTVEETSVDLMLLDLMLPRLNGLQVLATMAGRDGPPVMVLSAVKEVGARVEALNRGAVDFVVKPFHPAELVARVRTHLSQGAPDAGRPRERYLQAGGICLDLDRRHASTSQVEASLSEREFGLLAHLMRRRGEVCRRDELLHDVWGLDFDPGSNVVDVCMRRLRGKLGQPPIETIRNVGYCFYGA